MRLPAAKSSDCDIEFMQCEGSHLYNQVCANAGDSRAILCRNGKPAPDFVKCCARFASKYADLHVNVNILLLVTSASLLVTRSKVALSEDHKPNSSVERRSSDLGGSMSLQLFKLFFAFVVFLRKRNNKRKTRDDLSSFHSLFLVRFLMYSFDIYVCIYIYIYIYIRNPDLHWKKGRRKCWRLTTPACNPAPE